MKLNHGSAGLRTTSSRQGRPRHTRRRALRVVPESVEALRVVHTVVISLDPGWHQRLMPELPLFCLQGR